MKKILVIIFSFILIIIVLLGCTHQSNIQTDSELFSEVGKPSILNSLGLEIDDERYGGSYIDNGIYYINIVGDTEGFKVIEAKEQVLSVQAP